MDDRIAVVARLVLAHAVGLQRLARTPRPEPFGTVQDEFGAEKEQRQHYANLENRLDGDVAVPEVEVAELEEAMEVGFGMGGGESYSGGGAAACY